uniref:Uncharacterized protein n=1 Tax=Arundo donax TaxID=35708 RepID=A0A0A8Z819_ARUDO
MESVCWQSLASPGSLVAYSMCSENRNSVAFLSHMFGLSPSVTRAISLLTEHSSDRE